MIKITPIMQIFEGPLPPPQADKPLKGKEFETHSFFVWQGLTCRPIVVDSSMNE